MSRQPLPQWAYVPGDAYEANADYATLAQVKLPVPSAFRGYVPASIHEAKCTFSRFGLDVRYNMHYIAYNETPKQSAEVADGRGRSRACGRRDIH